MGTAPRRQGHVGKSQLEHICSRCHRVNRRGSLCLLQLHNSHDCARRAFLQRHNPELLRPRLPVDVPSDTGTLPVTTSVMQPTRPPVPDIVTLRARYGNPLSRWRGVFARLHTPVALDDTTTPS